MINQEYKDTYSLVVINWFRKDWEYLISQYSRISASLYSCLGGGGCVPPPPPPPRVTSPICSQERSSYLIPAIIRIYINVCVRQLFH